MLRGGRRHRRTEENVQGRAGRGSGRGPVRSLGARPQGTGRAQPRHRGLVGSGGPKGHVPAPWHHAGLGVAGGQKPVPGSGWNCGGLPLGQTPLTLGCSRSAEGGKGPGRVQREPIPWALQVLLRTWPRPCHCSRLTAAAPAHQRVAGGHGRLPGADVGDVAPGPVSKSASPGGSGQGPLLLLPVVLRGPLFHNPTDDLLLPELLLLLEGPVGGASQTGSGGHSGPAWLSLALLAASQRLRPSPAGL